MSKHVLVVEDDPMNAIVFRKVLERRGYKVTVTEKAEEILELARGGDVDLVIMDVSLAHTRWEGNSVSGIELCRMIKSDSQSAAVPVMLATAHAMRGDAESLLTQSGAERYVSKPIVDHAEFLRTVESLFREAA